MGGLIRSKAIAAEAKKRNISLIVGAQVGETSVLTRAGLTIASAYSSHVRAQEGAFGTWLLKADVAQPPLMMETDGHLHWRTPPTLNNGLGLPIQIENNNSREIQRKSIGELE